MARPDKYSVRFRNDSGEQVPAFAVLLITGYDDDEQVVTIDKPDADNLDPAGLLINGQVPIEDGEFGSAAEAGPILALTSGDPAAEDDLGTEADEWHLLAGNTGYTAWSDADDDDLAVVKGRSGTTPLGTATIHVTGRPQNTTPGPRRWYPSAISETDPATWVRSDGQSVKLLQIKDAELATDGAGYYVAKKLAGRVTFEGVEYLVYETEQRRRVVDVLCVAGETKVVFEGAFEGDADAGSAPYGGYDFSSVDDSAFMLLFWP